MAEDVLVEDQIEQGYEFLRRLARAGERVSVAFWARRDEGFMWTFWLAYDLPAGNIGSYQVAREAAKGLPDIKPAFLSLIPDSDPAAALALQLRQQRGPQLHFRVGPSLLRGVGLHEALVYPKVGAMSPTEVLVNLAWAMNRTGGPSLVTLTLADGKEVRALPMAVRSSSGGARLEMRDPFTNDDVPAISIANICSVWSDQLAS